MKLHLQNTSVSQEGDACLVVSSKPWRGHKVIVMLLKNEIIKMQLRIIRVAIYCWNNMASKQSWAHSCWNVACWPCFYSPGQFIKEAGLNGGYLLDYWQCNDCQLCWRSTRQQRQSGCIKLIGARTSKVRRCIKKIVFQCLLDLCDAVTFRLGEALKVYSLMKRKQKAALVNL